MFDFFRRWRSRLSSGITASPARAIADYTHRRLAAESQACQPGTEIDPSVTALMLLGLAGNQEILESKLSDFPAHRKETVIWEFLFIQYFAMQVVIESLRDAERAVQIARSLHHHLLQALEHNADLERVLRERHTAYSEAFRAGQLRANSSGQPGDIGLSLGFLFSKLCGGGRNIITVTHGAGLFASTFNAAERLAELRQLPRDSK